MGTKNFMDIVSQVFDDMDRLNRLDPDAMRVCQELMLDLMELQGLAEESTKAMVLFKAGLLKGMLYQLEKRGPDVSV